MSICADYANVFETEFRPRRRASSRLRRAVALVVWTGLLIVQPKLALQIWRERA